MKIQEKKKQQIPDNGNNVQENDMVNMLDALTEFEDFRETVLPAIQKDLKAGYNAKQLREKYLALLQARQITDALMAPTGEAADIAQRIIDREEGRATEKKEVRHRFEELPDQQLDAVLESMMKKAATQDEDSTEH
jgi:uncharacterized protein YehS (DUF1456 family)